jgi:tetratricopeptide (TPR) repeat protein
VSFPFRKLLLAFGLILAPLGAFAQTDSTPSFSEKSGEKLKELQPLVDAHNYDGSISLLAQLLKDNPPDSYDAFFIQDLLGKLYWQGKDDPATAIRNFKVVMELGAAHPNYTNTKDRNQHILWLAQANYQLAIAVKNNNSEQDRLYDESAKYMKQYLSIVPVPTADDEFLYAMLLYSKASMIPGHVDIPTLKEAEEATKKCLTLAIHPKTELYQLLVAELIQQSDYKNAADYFELLVKIKPQSKDFWGQLFQCYNNLANTEEKNPKIQRTYYARAINTIERAQKLGMMKAPRDNLNLVSMYYAVGQFGRATDIMHAGLLKGTIESTDSNWMNLAYFYQQVGDDVSAINTLKEGMQKFPNNSDFDFKVASIYQEDYNTQETYNYCKSAVEKNAFKTLKAATAYQYLAFSAFELGKYEEALSAAEKAIKLNGPKKVDRSLNGLKEAIQTQLAQREALKKANTN